MVPSMVRQRHDVIEDENQSTIIEPQLMHGHILRTDNLTLSTQFLFVESHGHVLLQVLFFKEE